LPEEELQVVNNCFSLTDNLLMTHIARFILRLLGWNIYVRAPLDIPKAVIIMAPHTSNWDFILGRLAFFCYRISPRILIKKEAFTPWLGRVLRWLGGIPVDRRHSQNTVKEISRCFNKNDRFYLLITPEGTRRKVKNWKRGFYFIALNAKVPIFFGFLDYRKKEGGIGMMMEPSGNFEADFKIIENFYRDKTARHPEKFNLTPAAGK
jgi:1-acyl-sn-glycerol-3-phosphate acyltransferase